MAGATYEGFVGVGGDADPAQVNPLRVIHDQHVVLPPSL
jgi:hypothetical protein